MWVFGYGSLMWDGWEKAFGGIRIDQAVLNGFHRSFNKNSVKNWGTRSVPCPTLGLEPAEGDQCVGTAFEFSDDLEDLLKNPQTLKLLIKSRARNTWPESREDVFRMACEKLIAESNIEHEAASRHSSPDSRSLIKPRASYVQSS